MFELAKRIKRIQESERAGRKLVIPKETIRLDSGEPNFSTPLHIQEAAIKAMQNNFTHYVNAYGDETLREAICTSLDRDYGIKRNIENILVTSGGSEAVYLIAAVYINPDDEVLVMDPDYSAYAEAVKFFGGKPIPVPVREDFHLDLDLIEDKASEKLKMIFLSSPCNPTGAVYTEEEIKRLSEIARKHNSILVADEVYHKLVYDGNKHYSVCQLEDAKDRTILLNSFSKTYAMTGWRVGYLVASSEIVKNLAGLHKSLLICANAPAQKACATAISGPQLCVDLMIEEYHKRRQLAQKILTGIDGITLKPCEGAFYCFPRFDHNISSKELTQLLSENNLLVRSGTEFGENGEKHIRITFATSMENIEKGLLRLKETLGRLD